MESTAPWAGPYELQLAATHWTAEEGPAGDAQAWAAPAAGYPLEYASIVDIFGSSCSLQPYAVTASSSSSGEQQDLVEYNYYNYYAAAAQNDGPVEKATTQEDLLYEEQLETYMKNPKKLFQEREKEFEDAYDAKFMKQKMHRYPPSIRALDNDGLYTVPRVVAIGPYHHYGGERLKETEKVKHVAAIHCMKKSLLEVQDLYQVVVSAAVKINARGLYDHKDVMAGMDYEDEFLPMMFYDACFLVMYMLQKWGTECELLLSNFFESNDNDIAHDIMLLENQIPLQVVDAVMNKCTHEPKKRIEKFIASCKDAFLQDRIESRVRVNWDEDYYNEAPHLLGLLRFHIVGKSSRSKPVPDSDFEKMKSIPISAGAIELAEMGIFLTADKTTDEIPARMSLKRKWVIFTELPMVPLSLNDLRASTLVNMAALELCTTPNFLGKEARSIDSAVCSYLLLLSMLVHREEDVHELRSKGILQGAGFTNNKTLDFFTRLQSLRIGRRYARVMIDIERYKVNRWGWWLWLYKFVYKNWKIIAATVSAVSAFASILGTLLKLKGAR